MKHFYNKRTFRWGLILALFLSIAFIYFSSHSSCAAGLVPCTDNCNLCYLLVGISNIFQYLTGSLLAVTVILGVTISGLTFIVSGSFPKALVFAKSSIESTAKGALLALFGWLIINSIMTIVGFKPPQGGAWWQHECAGGNSASLNGGTGILTGGTSTGTSSSGGIFSSTGTTGGVNNNGTTTSGTGTGANIGGSAYNSTGAIGINTNGIPAGGIGIGVGNSGATGTTGTGGSITSTPSTKLSPIQPDTKLIRFTAAGETHQLKVNFDNSLAGTNTTGIVDITSKAAYTSSNSRILTVDGTGLVKDTYSYQAGDPSPATATITISYQGYTITVSVEAIDRTKCVAVNPTDAKPDDKRLPIVFIPSGFSDAEMDKYKERVGETAKINVPPATNENYTVWRSDLPNKDACNFSSAIKVTLHNDGARPEASPTNRTIELHYLAPDSECTDYKTCYGDPNMSLAHEMGHADGGLADEYVEEGGDPEGVEGYDHSIRYNCFRDDTKESPEEKTFNEICAYFKGIAPGYDCGSFDGAIEVGYEPPKYDNTTKDGIKRGCNYIDTDKYGYKWYRSLDYSLMNTCGFNGIAGEECTYGIVGETLYKNRLSKMKGN